MVKAKEVKAPKSMVKLAPLNIKTIKVKVKGLTPLLMDRLSEEVLQEIEDKQTGVAKSSKKKRDITQEINRAIHLIDPNKKPVKNNIGFPAAGFKGAMIGAAPRVGDRMFSKLLICGSIRIRNSVDGLIPIKFKKQSILKHNISHNTKYTPQFEGWSCELVIDYDSNNISPQDIATLINYGGFYVGIGAWRPTSRDGGSGEYGTFTVA